MSAGVRIPGLSRRLRLSVYDHVFDNDTHEVGGVLVGSLGADDMPVVSGSIAALEARGERASVTFTHDAWSSIHARMESDFPNQQIVGWYHSHPGFGIFLSGHDMFIQENFFSDERQIAYVIDPHAGTEGVFGWRGGKVELIEEGPAGRQGTGGRGNDDDRSRQGIARYGGLAAVLAAFVAVGVALLISGGSSAGSTAKAVMQGAAARGATPALPADQGVAGRSTTTPAGASPSPSARSTAGSTKTTTTQPSPASEEPVPEPAPGAPGTAGPPAGPAPAGAPGTAGPPAGAPPAGVPGTAASPAGEQPAPSG